MLRFVLPLAGAVLLAFSTAAGAQSSNVRPFFPLDFLFGSIAPPPPSEVSPAATRSTVARTAPRSVRPTTRPPGANISRRIDPKFLPRMVRIDTAHPKGTIIVDTRKRFLFLVLGNGQAMRYGVGVGRPGFEWAGTHSVTRKAEWPSWTPPAAMRRRQPELPTFMEGGPENPLGARALYLGSTLYRIHGSNQPWTIGHAVSSGCIRMRNEDVMDLYQHVSVGAKVVVI